MYRTNPSSNQSNVRYRHLYQRPSAKNHQIKSLPRQYQWKRRNGNETKENKMSGNPTWLSAARVHPDADRLTCQAAW